MFLVIAFVTVITPAQASGGQDVILTYTLDRSAVPQVNYSAITLRIYIGSAKSVYATDDGLLAPVNYNPLTGYALVTASGTTLRVVAHQSAITPQTGTFTKTVLRDNKQWVWSHGFDDNVLFKQSGIPAFESYGWRATIYLIGSKIVDTRSEAWAVDRTDIMSLVNKGWAIGNHTWSHLTVDQIGGTANATADVLRMDSYLRQAINEAGRPDYRLMSFAAPEFDTNYLPILMNLRSSGNTGLFFDDSGNNFFLRMDPGAVESYYSRFGLFDYNAELGRDFRINDYGTNDEYDIGFRADLINMLSQVDDSHHYWLNTFSHDVDSQYPSTGIFAFMFWLYYNYGPGGNNTVWVAPAEEVYSYKMVYDNIKISLATPSVVAYTNITLLPSVSR